MIRLTAINSNGRTGGITRPSARGQEVVIREDYRKAGDLALSDTSYFECHGTGTYVGDPIEVAAIGTVFAPERSAADPLLVGSVKSNVGHGEGASALASIMKVVLSLDNRARPPVFDLQTRNPKTDFEGAKVQPVTELTPWPADKLQRAGINSFGYEGANGHCIIDHTLSTVRKPVRAPLQTTGLGFVFTGQGAQGHAMGAKLFEYRVFRTAIEYLDRVPGGLTAPPAWSLYSILSGDCDEAAVQSAEISQVVCTALQVGLVDLLASWSVRPSGVAGHSSSEMVAAYTSGRITAAEAIVAAYLHGQAVSGDTQTDAMLAVGLGHDQVTKYLGGREDEVRVAAMNFPSSVTLSGDLTAIDEISAALIADGIFNRRLQTGGNAYHSRDMIPVGRQYIKMLSMEIERFRKFGLTDAEQRY
ncbi:MAG: hypothetical protein Q9212_007180 [Teloschistes hypoglaucus]